MQALVIPHAASPRQNRGMATIAIVGAAHVALIYALLVALDIVPAPLPVHPTDVRVIDQVQPKTNPPPPPIDPHIFVRPTTDTVPTPPHFPTDNGDHGGITQVKPDGGGTGPLLQPVYVGAVSLAATHTIPAYPALDRRLGHEGAVRLKLDIDAQGRVSGAAVEQSSGFEGLDAAAVQWVIDHWRYKPATMDGKAVPATSEVMVTFHLTQG